MGTDQLGRDVFSRLVYGARISVFVGLGVLAISSLLSTGLTLISGYYLTSVDLVLQRFIEVWQLLPPLVILIAILGIYGATPLHLIVILGVLGGFNGSRILRSVVIQIRSMPYIEAAKAIAASDARVMLRHILPNVAYLIIVGSTAAVSGAIAAEAGLAILGFGVSPVYPTWGRMINDSREFLRVAPYLAIFPVMALALTIYGFNLLGDALRDVLDPRLRGEGR